MSRRSRPHYHSGLEWILGVAFEDTLTRPARLAQRFTHVRCCGSPRASSPHGLAAPALASRDGKDCVQLPLARGCYHLAPRRTFTSNPVPMPGTPSVGLRPHSGATAAAHSHPGCRIALPQEDSIPRKGGQYWTRKGVAIGRDLTLQIVDPSNPCRSSNSVGIALRERQVSAAAAANLRGLGTEAGQFLVANTKRRPGLLCPQGYGLADINGTLDFVS